MGESSQDKLQWSKTRCYRKKRRWLLGAFVGVVVVADLFRSLSVVAKQNPDYSRSFEYRNSLWDDELVCTGERRGPIFPGPRRPRIPQPPPSREESSRELMRIQGGQQRNSLKEDTSVGRVPVLLDRWLKQKAQRGSITIDIYQPAATHELPSSVLSTSVRNTGDVLMDETTNKIQVPVVSSNRTSEEASRNVTLSSRPSLQHFVRQTPLSSSPPLRTRPEPGLQMIVSVTPISLFRLAQNLGKASVATLAAFGATLRLLAPMIVARRLLNSVGYMCYDYYNGRYIRTTYNKRVQRLSEMEVPATLRACGRMGIQLASMMLAGGTARTLLEAAPCFLPELACRYWFGCIWVGCVMATTVSIKYWMKRFPILQIDPVYASATSKLTLTRSWHILQWMKDPETWLLNLTRLQRHPSRVNQRRRQNKPFRPDPLLFPSTWPPLMLLSVTAMVHAIARTLPTKTGANTRILMQDFCLAITILDEWKRLFLHEHRITLGLAWSAMSFAAFFVLSVSAALEVGWLSCGLLLPIVFSCLVSGWMNAVLYSEHHAHDIN